MTEGLWWQHGVIYQVYPRSFKDSNGDGIGDLAGITEKLDYLANTLGVDAVWLSPFYPSPMADFGYDVADYIGVDPMFGTVEDMERLIAAAHQRKVRVIVDFVPNHSSDRHPWFLESRSSKDSPKRDWYIWRDAKPDGSPPNNWMGVFGGTAWEWDETTGQYYLHSFLKEQPDLNWRNPQVKAAMFDAIRTWLERGVDGFRIDVAHMIMKHPDLPDNPTNPEYRPGEGNSRPYDAILHVHDQAHPDVHGVYQDLRRLLDEYSSEHPRMMVGEIHIFDWPVWATYYGEQLNEFHLPFNFGLIFSPWRAGEIRAVVDNIEAALAPSGGWPNYVLGNHDSHRIASRVGAEAARMAMMLLLTLRGTPTLYNGEEIGMHDVHIPPHLIQDPFEIMTPGLGHGRDPERTPMQWDDTPNAGFCAPEVTPWLPVAPDADRINVAVEEAQPTSFLALTRALLSIRQAEPALHAGTYRALDPVPDDCFAYMREADDRRYLVVLNFGDHEEHLSFPDLGLGVIALATDMERTGELDLGGFQLNPSEGLLITL